MICLKDNAPTATPKPLPTTGDAGQPGLWIVLSVVGLGAFAVGLLRPIFRKKK